MAGGGVADTNVSYAWPTADLQAPGEASTAVTGSRRSWNNRAVRPAPAPRSSTGPHRIRGRSCRSTSPSSRSPGRSNSECMARPLEPPLTSRVILGHVPAFEVVEQSDAEGIVGRLAHCRIVRCAAGLELPRPALRGCSVSRCAHRRPSCLASNLGRAVRSCVSMRATVVQIDQLCIRHTPLSRTGSAAPNGGYAHAISHARAVAVM